MASLRRKGDHEHIRTVVSDRLFHRRAALKPFCEVDPVKPHLRFVRYIQIARSLYREVQVYHKEKAWDDAYIRMARFIKLCARVIPAHPDYESAATVRDREWIHAQALEGKVLFEAILDGMEEEERQKYEEEMLEEELAMSRSVIAHSSLPPSNENTSKEAPTVQSSQASLEDRLKALKFSNSVGPVKDEKTSWMARSHPVPSTHNSHVNYPAVGKASWIPSTGINRRLPSQSFSPLKEHRAASSAVLQRMSSGTLRTLQLPTELIAKFTAIAAPNTNQHPHGIETCGIMAGYLHEEMLIVTSLIIPKQEGSSDMCTMKNEEELFEYCFSNNLLTLGWIHTHPTQTCFLSSVDIHTQCGFQSILPESVAIVVAPNDPVKNVGIFRLTQPTGLELIQNCRLTGFHQHPSDVCIYSDALSCQWFPDLPLDVMDMRYFV